MNERRTDRTVSKRLSLPGSRLQRTIFLAALVVIGVIAGVAPSGLPVKILFSLLAAGALFVLIYNNIQLGLMLFFALNLTIPQAGPTANVGMQVAVVGETRGLHFNFQEIVIAMVLVAWLIQLFIKKPGVTWKETSPLLVPVILYFLSAIFSSFVGLLNGGSDLIVIFRFTRTAIFAYIFFVFINNLRKRKQLQQLVLVLLICSSLVAAFGLVQKVKGEDWSRRFAEKYFAKLGVPAEVNYVAGGSGETQVYRINSTFLHPNVLGAYMVIALPFFVSLLWLYRKRWQRALLVCGLGLNLIVLFYTGSRAAWIAAGVITLLYGIFGFVDKRMVLVAVTLLLVVAMVIVMIKPPDFVKKRFASVSAKEATSARVYQYKYAIDFFMEHPILGVGLGMEGQYLKLNNIQNQWGAVENAFLTYLVSTGLLGFTFFLLLFIVFLGMMLFARNRSADDPFVRFHAEAFLLSMVGIIVASQFGAWLLFAIPMWTMFWAFFSMGACLYNMYRERALASMPRRAMVTPATQTPAAGMGAAGPLVEG